MVKSSCNEIHLSESIEQAYLDNKIKNVWQEIFDHLKDTDFLEIQTDYNETKRTTYIWVHILNVSREANKIKMESVIDDLNLFYEREIRKCTVQKLMTQICNQLRSERYFADALCEYQSNVGKIKTQDFLHTYFNDIKRTQISRRTHE